MKILSDINNIKELCSKQINIDKNKFSDKDNLIKLGLDSIGFMQCLYIFQKNGYAITLKDLYLNPTIKGWYKILKKSDINKKERKDNIYTHKTIKNAGEFSLTPIQHAYFVGRLNKQTLGGVACQIYQEFDGTPKFTPESLEKALVLLSKRHPMLNIVFHQQGTQFWSPNPNRKYVTYHDFSKLPKDEYEKKLLQLREKLSHQVLNVESGQLIDFHMISLPNNRYRLCTNIDMLIADGTSYSLLFTELCLLLSGEILPQLDEHYDFYHYLQDKKQYENKESAYQYWKNKIPNLPDSPLLPLYMDPEKINKIKIKRLSWTFSSKEWKNFSNLAKENNITPSIALATCFSSVLARWTGQNSLLLNFTLFDRKPLAPAVNNIIADFTNVILLEMKTDNRPLISLSKDNQNTFIEAWQHSDYSGIDIIRDLRKNGTHPYGCPVVFTSHINQPLIDKNIESVLGSIGWGISQTPQVWLDHMAINKSGNIVLQWDYNNDLFRNDVITTIFDVYISRIRQLANDPNAWIETQPDLIPKKQLKNRISVIKKDNSLLPHTLHKSIFHNYSNSSKIAVIDIDSQEWSYKKLLSKATILSDQIIQQGYKPEDRIGVCMPKGVGQIISVSGYFINGGTYVPIDVLQPEERINRIAKNAQLSLLIVSDSDPSYSIYATFCNRIVWQKVQPSENKPLHNIDISPHQAAYVIYTSGSTGEPKGVVVSHASAMNTCLDLNRRYNISDKDRVLAISALHFDLSVYDIFGVLNAGGTLVLVKEDERRNPDAWLRLINQHKITLWNSVPALFDMLLTYAEGIGSSIPQSLLLIYLSGDWIGLDLPTRYYNFCPDGQIVAMGGATEAAIWSNYFNVTTLDPSWSSIPYGYPLSNQRYRIVNARGEDCPDWVSGELWIGGAGVALGYLNDPEKTAQQFVKQNGENWYKTGDMGRYLPGGILEFLGRRDRQVKIGGYRIEPGEIDAAFNKLQGVQNAITLCLGNGNKEKALHSFVILNSGNYQDIISSNSTFSPLYYLRSTPINVQQQSQETTIIAGFLYDYLTEQNIDFDNLLSEKKSADDHSIIASYQSLMANWLNLIAQYPQTTLNSPPTNSTQRTLIENLQRHKNNLTDILKGKKSALTLFDDPYWSPEQVTMRIDGMHYSLENLLQQIRELHHSLKRPIKIIQLGARSGISANYILQRLPTNMVTLLLTDESLSMVTQANQNLSDYQNSYAEPLTEVFLHKNRYSADIIWMNNYLHRLDSPQKEIQKFVSLCAPSGMIFIQEVLHAPAQSLISISLLQQNGSDPADELLTAKKCKDIFSASTATYKSEGVNGEILTQLYQAPEKIYLPDKNKLEHDLRQFLPDYMIPKHIYFLTEFPLTANGKIDNQSLKLYCQEYQEEYLNQQPINGKEQIIITIWQKLLGTNKIHRHSHFFREGGDSLVAIRLISDLNHIGYQVELEHIFAYPILSDFAQNIKQSEVFEKQPAISHNEAYRYNPFPLTDIQQAYLVGRQNNFTLGGVGTHFFVHFIAENLDVPKLERTINQLISRHDMLRGVIINGQQQVLKKVPYYSVKTHYIPTEKSDAFLVLRAQLANIVYDPEIWPLFTIQVIKTKEQPDHIFISLDNLFLDGMSMQIFFSELKTLYMEPNHQFIPLDITFRDYIDCDAYPINTQNDWEYWLTRLPQLPPAPQLPLIKDPAQIVQPRFSRLQTSLSTSVWQALQQVAQQNNVTPAALLIAAYCATLSAWSKSPELTINLTLFNRHPVHPQINEVLGDFTSLQLLDWYTCDLWSNSISMMQKRLHKDMQHRSVSAIKVMREMAIQRQMSHIEIPVVFTCALGYKHDEGFLSHHSWLKPVWGISQTPQTWLDHQVYESDGELYLNWDFVEQLFDYTTIFSMFQQYEHILTKLATEPQSWQLPLNKLIPRCNNLVITPVFNAKNNQNTHYKQSTDTQKTGQTIQKLQQLVKQVIGITLAPETNFFEAGASSLQLVQLHAALQKNGYSHITITDLFASPNLSTLAQLLWQNTSPTCEQYSDRDKHKNKRKKRLQLRTHSR